METKVAIKVAEIYSCQCCDYNTSRKSSFTKHLSTDKHQNAEKVNKSKQKVAKSCNLEDFCPYCSKPYSLYKSRVGIWKHKKICENKLKENQIKPDITPELLIELIKQNKEMQQALLDQSKTMVEMAQKAGNNIISNINNNNNNNNKTFNLQFFLNETCKDAINLTDFVNQIQVSLDDLEETGRIGYAEGISKVFIKNLNDIDYTERPIHCNDYKRETIYIKDNDQWTKDDEKKSGLTKAIKQVAYKNIKQISEWQKIHPEFSDPESRENDKYMNIVLNSMSGSTVEEQQTNINKIIKNITKEVVIEK